MAKKSRKQRKKQGYVPVTPVDTPHTDGAETELGRIWNTLNTGVFALKDFHIEEDAKYTMIGFKRRDLLILMSLVNDRMSEIKNIE